MKNQFNRFKSNASNKQPVKTPISGFLFPIAEIYSTDWTFLKNKRHKKKPSDGLPIYVPAILRLSFSKHFID